MTRRPRAILTLIATALLLPWLLLAERAEPMGTQGPGPEIKAGAERDRDAQARQKTKPEPVGRTDETSPPARSEGATGDQGHEDGAAAPAEMSGQSATNRDGDPRNENASDRLEDEAAPKPDPAQPDEVAEKSEPAPAEVAETESVSPQPPADAVETAPSQPLKDQDETRPWRAESRTRAATGSAPGQPQPSGAATGQQSPGATGQPVRLFRTAAFRGNFDALPKWKRVLSKAEAQVRVLNSCSGAGCPPGATSWQRIMSQARGLVPMEQLKAVNSFFNKWPYRLDQDAYGTSDWWATPQEFLKISGDCEDFAITKYFALRELGHSPENLRIVILKDRIRGIAHAVLTVFVDGDALVLDNVTSVVFSHDKYKHYAPYYSLNERYRWSHIPLDTKP